MASMSELRIVPSRHEFANDFAVLDGVVVGTAAAIQHSLAEIELAKMAEAPASRGLGVGRLLAQTVSQFACGAGATKVVLLSNTVLAPAIQLYRRLGLVVYAMPSDTGYSRANISMELVL